MAIYLAKVFQDHMILQRDKEIKIWGRIEPEAEITAWFQETSASAKADENGNFVIKLAPLTVSEGEDLLLQSNDSKVVIHDVAVGEVWIAGGQSNMEFFMHYEKHYQDERNKAENPNIRFFDVPELSYDGQDEIFDFSEFGKWRKVTSSDLEWFSGVGYYFAKSVQARLGVPVGVIGCNFGGTTVSAWMKKESVYEVGGPWIADYETKRHSIRDMGLSEEKFWELHKTYHENDKGHPFDNDFNNTFMYKTPPVEECMQYFATKIQSGQWDPRLNSFTPESVPGALYEHMLKSIAGYGIRGFIFYQGESDEKFAEIYSIMLTRMIEDWRELWDAKLPFLEVQLPGFGSWMGAPQTKWRIIRDQQQAVSDAVEKVYMASISDAGEEKDIHPKDKKTPGERLALLALGEVYGQNLCCNAPRIESVKAENGKLILTFSYGDGLYVDGDIISALEVNNSQNYTFKTEENNLILKLPDSIEHADISFARKGFYKVNLKNKAGIPAVPFLISI